VEVRKEEEEEEVEAGEREERRVVNIVRWDGRTAPMPSRAKRRSKRSTSSRRRVAGGKAPARTRAVEEGKERRP